MIFTDDEVRTLDSLRFTYDQAVAPSKADREYDQVMVRRRIWVLFPEMGTWVWSLGAPFPGCFFSVTRWPDGTALLGYGHALIRPGDELDMFGRITFGTPRQLEGFLDANEAEFERRITEFVMSP